MISLSGSPYPPFVLPPVFRSVRLRSLRTDSDILAFYSLIPLISSIFSNKKQPDTMAIEIASAPSVSSPVSSTPSSSVLSASSTLKESSGEAQSTEVTIGPIDRSVASYVGLPPWSEKNEQALLAPYTYIISIPGKDLRTQLLRAFNAWYDLPEETFKVISEVVGMLHNASLLFDDIEDYTELVFNSPILRDTINKGLGDTVDTTEEQESVSSSGFQVTETAIATVEASPRNGVTSIKDVSFALVKEETIAAMTESCEWSVAFMYAISHCVNRAGLVGLAKSLVPVIPTQNEKAMAGIRELIEVLCNMAMEQRSFVTYQSRHMRRIGILHCFVRVLEPTLGEEIANRLNPTLRRMRFDGMVRGLKLFTPHFLSRLIPELNYFRHAPPAVIRAVIENIFATQSHQIGYCVQTIDRNDPPKLDLEPHIPAASHTSMLEYLSALSNWESWNEEGVFPKLVVLQSVGDSVGHVPLAFTIGGGLQCSAINFGAPILVEFTLVRLEVIEGLCVGIVSKIFFDQMAVAPGDERDIVPYLLSCSLAELSSILVFMYEAGRVKDVTADQVLNNKKSQAAYRVKLVTVDEALRKFKTDMVNREEYIFVRARFLQRLARHFGLQATSKSVERLAGLSPLHPDGIVKMYLGMSIVNDVDAGPSS
ncbi:hypothetical protein NMY22_g3317 [Coprinellus aureogranulatus]|nr:hypothetical protein NMY22_g3317 [Coprinellus aureogranulatus]